MVSWDWVRASLVTLKFADEDTEIQEAGRRHPNNLEKATVVHTFSFRNDTSGTPFYRPWPLV